MSNKINALLEQRAKVVADMQSMLDTIESENRDFNDTEQSQYNKLEADVDSLKNRADRLKKAEDVQSSLGLLQGDPIKPTIAEGAPENKFASDSYKNAFYASLRQGKSVLTSDVLNALQIGTATEGGNITPESFETALVMIMNDISDIRQYANVIQTASDRNIPVENSLGVATWTGEEEEYTESDAAFGTLQLGAHKLSSIIKVSEELLQDAFFNLEAYLSTNFGKRFAIAEEAAFIAGNGSGKPTGIVSGASNSGVTFAGAAAITSDELIDVEYGLAKPYRKNAAWLFNDSTVKLLRKLKDADGQYIWQRGMQAGQPDRLNNYPIITSVAMPAATTGLKSVVFGDMSSYTIADRSNRVMQRLNELYAANGQVGFRMYNRTEGKVTDSAGIVYASQG